jgi:hypothetical protein
MVQSGQTAVILAQRQVVLAAAYRPPAPLPVINILQADEASWLILYSEDEVAASGVGESGHHLCVVVY